MPQKPKQGFTELDFRLGVTVGVAILIYLCLQSAIPAIGNYINLCIYALCCAFLADVDLKTTWRTGLIRVAVTSIGAILAFIPLFVFDLSSSELLLALTTACVLICCLVLAKLTGAIYVQCRLAAVAYILTIYTFHGPQYAAMGKTGYGFGLMWILSSLLGLVTSVLVVFLWDKIKAAVKKG